MKLDIPNRNSWSLKLDLNSKYQLDAYLKRKNPFKWAKGQCRWSEMKISENYKFQDKFYV